MSRPRRRLRPSGLRWRLAAWVAVVILVCTAVAFVAVYRGTATDLRHQIDQELRGDAHELAATLASAHDKGSDELASTADSYVRDQPFGAASTLLFVQIPGVGTRTNRPELFAAKAPDNHETIAEQQHENQLSSHLLSSPTGYSTVTLGDVGEVRLLKVVGARPRQPGSR